MQKADVLEGFDRPEKISEEAPVAYYELIQQGNSGFIQDGTERLPKPNEITAPSVAALMRRSYYFEMVNKIPQRVNIRYIYGITEIIEEKQDKAGMIPNPFNDRIDFKKGTFVVVREGNYIGLFDFLKNCSFNGSNPKRDKTVTARFKEVIPEKEKLDLNDYEFLVTDAMKIVQKLIIEKKNDKVKYDEEKVDFYCQMFNVAGSNYPSRLNGLIAVAKKTAKVFMDTIEAFETRFHKEVLRAEELGIIKFSGNVVEYVGKTKVILTVPGSFLKKEALREKLAEYFQSSEGAVNYTEFVAELEAAQKRALDN